jgi:hypothetical protein
VAAASTLPHRRGKDFICHQLLKDVVVAINDINSRDTIEKPVPSRQDTRSSARLPITNEH